MIPQLKTAWFSAQQPHLSFLELMAEHNGKWRYWIVLHEATGGAVYDQIQ